MKSELILGIIAAVLSGGPAVQTAPGPECAVYEALLAVAERDHDAPAWLRATTLRWSGDWPYSRSEIDASFPDLDEDLVEDFIERNLEAGPLPCHPEISGKNVYLVTEEAVSELDRRAQGRAFVLTDPNVSGVRSFSRVGFNAAEDEALLHDSFLCGARCGWGGLVHLRRENGRWSVVLARTLIQY